MGKHGIPSGKEVYDIWTASFGHTKVDLCPQFSPGDIDVVFVPPQVLSYRGLESYLVGQFPLERIPGKIDDRVDGRGYEGCPPYVIGQLLLADTLIV